MKDMGGSDNGGSRRAFLVGGVVATAAVAGPLAIAAASGGKLTTSWSPSAPVTADTELNGWLRSIGTGYTVRGESGSSVGILTGVFQPTTDLNRPASLRANPFTLYFEVDPRTAPSGQQTYAVVRSDGRSYKLFLGRGLDARGKAILYAIFN